MSGEDITVYESRRPTSLRKNGPLMNSSFGSTKFSRTRSVADYPLRGGSQIKADELGTSQSKSRFVRIMPEVWNLVRPLRWLLTGSFLLMIVNRLCSFAVPISSRYLINDVMYKHHFDKLPLIVGSVAGATCIQGITTYVLSKQLFNHWPAPDCEAANASPGTCGPASRLFL